VSDFSQGDGWRQASDGKWYAPETAPNAASSNPQGSPKARNPWRRFRGWPLWSQIVSWVVLAFILLVIVVAAAGGGDDKSSIATRTPVPPASLTPTTADGSATTSPPSTAASTTTLPPPTTPPTTPSTTPPTSPPTPAPASPATTTALSGLATLPVKGRAPLTGYSRAQFGPAWTDDVTVTDGHNGCDTRNDILRRDLTDIVIKPGTHGCTVASGLLHDPYTNTVITFIRGIKTSTVVQIDHVVALGDAWQTGAQQLSLAVRTNMANDPLELLAVSGPTNEQKGDADAASWLPPNNAFRCSYVAIQVAVKIRYQLWVTPAEHEAAESVLATCPTQPLPTGGLPSAASATAAPPSAGPLPTSAPPTTAAPVPGTTPANVPIVHPGAFCTPPGVGVTSKGTPMTCKPDSTGQRYRWSKA
jgi:Protein of unknown function (DUF1524)